MAKEKKNGKIIQTVVFHILKRSLIKFEGDDEGSIIDYIKLDEGFKKGTVLEVEYKDDKIVSIKQSDKVKADTQEEKKEEPVKEEKQADTTPDDKIEKLTVVIGGVAPDHSVCTWENSFKKWVTIAEELKVTDDDPVKAEELWKKQGLVGKNEVELTLTNDVITAVKLIATPNANNTSTNDLKVLDGDSDKSQGTSYKSSNGSYDEAVDKRTCINCAKDVIVALITKGELLSLNVEDAIKDITAQFAKSLNNL